MVRLQLPTELERFTKGVGWVTASNRRVLLLLLASTSAIPSAPPSLTPVFRNASPPLPRAERVITLVTSNGVLSTQPQELQASLTSCKHSSGTTAAAGLAHAREKEGTGRWVLHEVPTALR